MIKKKILIRFKKIVDNKAAVCFCSFSVCEEKKKDFYWSWFLIYCSLSDLVDYQIKKIQNSMSFEVSLSGRF